MHTPFFWRQVIARRVTVKATPCTHSLSPRLRDPFFLGVGRRQRSVSQVCTARSSTRSERAWPSLARRFYSPSPNTSHSDSHGRRSPPSSQSLPPLPAFSRAQQPPAPAFQFDFHDEETSSDADAEAEAEAGAAHPWQYFLRRFFRGALWLVVRPLVVIVSIDE